MMISDCELKMSKTLTYSLFFVPLESQKPDAAPTLTASLIGDSIIQPSLLGSAFPGPLYPPDTRGRPKSEKSAPKCIALWARIEKNRINSHPIIHCPLSEGVSEQASKRSRAREQSK